MRFLLIIALLFSAAAMALPARAQGGGGMASGAMADCHGMAAPVKAPADQPDAPLTKAHTCPGCATFAAPLLAGRAPPRPALPRDISVSDWRPSLLSAPVPPPPRLP